MAAPSSSPSTVPGRVDEVASRRPDAPAAWFPDRRLTYSELAQAATDVARRLCAAGVGAGDRIGVLLAQGSPEYLAFALGAMRIGAVVVSINARYRTGELGFVLDRTRPRLLVTTSWFRGLLERSDVPPDCLVSVIDADPPPEPLDGHHDGDVRRLEAAVDRDAPARIIFTSGTTAQPKGCVHSQRAMLAQGEAVAERLELTPDDRFWTPLPMFHTAGWSAMLAAQARGACFHHAGRFEPARALEQIVEERCTVLFPGFETIWMDVLSRPEFDPDALPAARLVINVGVPKVLELMQERLPQAPQISNTGSTEACGWLALGRPSDPLERRVHTVGRVLPGMEARIVDPETGRDTADGEPGELLFRGDCRFLCYHDDPEATAASIDADGWFHSGDLLLKEPDGNLVFLSRLKDMLKVGGENVAAAETESLLLSHDAVRAVNVVAAPDARYGEVPAAFVELEPGATASEGELIAFCVGRIASFKAPRYVRLIDEWPMSGTKVKKVELRERIASELERSGVAEAPPIEPVDD